MQRFSFWRAESSTLVGGHRYLDFTRMGGVLGFVKGFQIHPGLGLSLGLIRNLLLRFHLLYCCLRFLSVCFVFGYSYFPGVLRIKGRGSGF